MKIFMTGGTGFVGTYLAKHLISEGHEVTILTPGVHHGIKNDGTILPHR